MPKHPHLLGLDRYNAAMAHLIYGDDGVRTALAEVTPGQLRAEVARRAAEDARAALAAGRGDAGRVVAALAARTRSTAQNNATSARVRAEIGRGHGPARTDPAA